jgi:predicted metal-dependent hydrolase
MQKNQETKLKSKPFELITDTSKENVLNYTKFKFLTRVLNSLSLTFVIGERFFCDAVRLHQSCVDDETYFEIKEFIKQEAQHSLAHRSLNRILKTTYKVDTEKLERSAHSRLQNLGFTPDKRLLTTVCLEDLTAFGGFLYIKGGKFFFKRELQSSKLWEEHAKEEVQHHFLAKTVYEQNYKPNKIKYFLHFIKTSYTLFLQLVENYQELKRAEKEI